MGLFARVGTFERVKEIVLQMPQADAFAAVLDAFQRVGCVRTVQEQVGKLVGSVWSGIWNMNIAYLTIQVRPLNAVQTKVVFTATAREGLIFQNTASKAIARVIAAMPQFRPEI